ncbi:inositol monophosphatase family protein [Glaciihabitans sp. dw_435]|uniref:inositol monophosphatase family protein n=1 Tax=Glaciihabitans sp. dw_435 TaxID=2720081 RepID=UPI001BD5D4B1|nr:inositol monophosphatase family protein [Glaciihabitans sp. dw_435]
MSNDLLDLARDVAFAAGELVYRRRAEGVTVADHKSSPVDVVTLADRESEALIRSMLADARPNDAFFGEETSGEAAARDGGTSGLTWIVDPIDGTVNYLYDIPHYAISITVVEGDPNPFTWNALAGCVLNPATGEVFTATAGEGAWLGDTAIHAAPSVDLAQALVATGFGYDAEVRRAQGAVVAQLLPEVRDIRRMGTASLDLCFVANGRLNAYFERGLQHWDHAAGALIAREAGARVTGFDGVAASREFTLAGAPELAAALEARLIDLGV